MTEATDSSPLEARGMVELIADLRRRLAAGETTITLRVPDPDHSRGCYAGERYERNGEVYVHRPLQVWLDLAERLDLRLRTPRPLGDGSMELRLEPLAEDPGWRREGPQTERYGRESPFQRISKLEEPHLVADVADALDRLAPPDDARVLGLGINRGDEFKLLCQLRPALAERGSFVGIDHSASALELARGRFSAAKATFIEADLDDLPTLEIGRFDLILAFGTLQSPGVGDRALLRHLVRDRLRAQGGLLIAMPNCRYVDGEQIYGARMRNFRRPDLSLLLKDSAFYRRYLNQHRHQVFVTGKYDLLLTAIPRT